MKKLLYILIALLIVGCEKESEAIINVAKKEAENIREEANKIQITTEKKLDHHVTECQVHLTGTCSTCKQN